MRMSLPVSNVLWMMLSAWLWPFCLPVITRQAAKISLPPPRLPPRNLKSNCDQSTVTSWDGTTTAIADAFECEGKQSAGNILDQSEETIRAIEQQSKDAHPVKKRLRFGRPELCGGTVFYQLE